MVLGDPVGVRKVDVVAHDPMAGRVVDLAGRSLDRIEDDVLVEAGHHSFRQPDTTRVARVEPFARNTVLPRRDLVHAGDTEDTEGGGELVHPVVESWGCIVGLTVIPDEAC